MATSIDKSVNWRNAAAAPDYQVAAQRVDTFVQGERNTKGMQVAAALENAAGVVSQVGKQKLQTQQEEARKATALQKDQARVAAAREGALFKEAQKSQNYDENSTFESVFSSVYSDQEAKQRYDAIEEGFKDNPEALAVFQNTFRLSTETPLIQAIGNSVQQQRGDTVSGLLPLVFEEALVNNPNNKAEAFRSTEAQLFSRLTDSKEDGGYGINKSIAADMLGSIFLSETLKRDSEGKANTFMAEQYILSGKGSNEMRDKLTTAVLNQQRFAAQERGVTRTEDKIVRDEQTKSVQTELMTGEYVTSDSNILARNDLNNDQKIYLVGVNQKIKEQQRIAAEPTRKAAAKRLFLKTKRDLVKAAVTGDYTSFGFAEGEVPTAEQLEANLTDGFLGKMADSNDFNLLVASGANSLNVLDAIDREGSRKRLTTQFSQLESEFKGTTFTRRMKQYSEAVLDNQPVKTYLDQEFMRVTFELVEDHVSTGKDLTSSALSLIYDEAATKVMQPLVDFAKSDSSERKEILEGGSDDDNTKELKEPNAKGLSMWDEASKANGGYPDDSFLKQWDAQNVKRPTQQDDK